MCINTYPQSCKALKATPPLCSTVELLHNLNLSPYPRTTKLVSFTGYAGKIGTFVVVKQTTMNIDSLTPAEAREVREAIQDRISKQEIKKEELLRTIKEIDASIETNKSMLAKITIKRVELPSAPVARAITEVDAPQLELSWTKLIRKYLFDAGRATSAEIGQAIADEHKIIKQKQIMDIKNRISGTCSSLYLHKKLDRQKIEGSDEYIYWLKD